MKTINIKYDIGTNVLFYDDNKKLKSGKIQNYLIQSQGSGYKILYFIRCGSHNRTYIRPEKDMIKEVNNKTPQKISYLGESAEKIVDEVLKDIHLFVQVVSVHFKSNSTTIKYKRKNSREIYTVTSYCHPEDTFSRKKGIEACLYKIIIKDFKNKLYNL